MNDLERARWFAEGAHAGQMYGNGERYAHHLEMVVAVLERFGVTDEDTLIAGWLHDTVEDTNVTFAAIADAFGVRVARTVEAVTDKPGKNRRERHAATYPLIRRTGGWRAILVKLADRIANMEYSQEVANIGKMAMYRKEFDEFKNMLLVEDSEGVTATEQDMWARLEELA